MKVYTDNCKKRGLGEGLLAILLTLVIMNRVVQQQSLLTKLAILEKQFTTLKGMSFMLFIVIQDVSRPQLVSSL